MAAHLHSCRLQMLGLLRVAQDDRHMPRLLTLQNTGGGRASSNNSADERNRLLGHIRPAPELLACQPPDSLSALPLQLSG